MGGCCELAARFHITTLPTPPHDPLLAFRSEFPILERTNYLVSNSLGAMPAAATERMVEYARDWSTRGVRAWEERWWDMPVKVGDEIAPLIGAGAGEVAMVANLTTAHAAILSSLAYAPPRDTIVMSALDFPSVRYVYEGLATRLGARIVIVESDDGMSIDEERICAAIDERTRLVCISDVFFKSAYVLDVARIVRHAHAMGALVATDSYHAVGVVPVDVKKSGVDWLTGGVLKWLCGGPGGAFIYASPALPRSRSSAYRLAGTRNAICVRRRNAVRLRRMALAERHPADSGTLCGDRGSACRCARRRGCHSRQEHAPDDTHRGSRPGAWMACPCGEHT